MPTPFHALQDDVHHHIVSALAHAGPQTTGDLASHLGVDEQTLEPLLAALADRHWLERETSGCWQLRQTLHLLSPDAVASALASTAPVALNSEVVLETGSTNDDLLGRSKAESIHGLVLLAEGQTGGRGRRGRVWVSPLATNLYLSLGWNLAPSASGPAGLSLAVGCALARALEPYAESPLQLKWPNDLYIAGKKLGGILIDIVGDPLATCTAVIGFGLNVKMPGQEGEAIDQPWTDLNSHSTQDLDRNALAVVCINAMVEALIRFDEGGFAAFRSDWDRYDYLRDRPIEVTGSPALRGMGAGVDETGALQVQTETGLVTVHGGEVSVRDRGQDSP